MNINTLLVFCILNILSSCNGQTNHTNISNKQTAQADTVQQLGNNIMVVYQDTKNNYWFGSWESGLYCFNGKTMLHYSTENGLLHNRINEIREDKYGNVFFNTSAGIIKFDGQNFVALNEIIPSNNAWKLHPDDLWFICPKYSGQVYRYDGKNLYKLQMPTNKLGDEFLSMHPNAPSPYAVYCSYKDRKGNIWFGTAALGACRYNGETFDWILEEDVTEVHDGPANGVRSIIEDKDGYFWFNSIYRYDVYGKSVSKEKFYNREISIGSLDGKKDGDLYEYLSIAKDNNDELWIATYNAGVWRYNPLAALGTDKKNITHYPVQQDSKDITLFSVYKDNHGTLWLGTHENGVFRFNGETFERLGM